MAEEAANDTENPKVELNETKDDIESKIHSAMLSRVPHFKEQADSLTFEGVRRLLEKDLGLEALALDVHKRYIRQCLVKYLDGTDDGNASKKTEEAGVGSIGEAAESPNGQSKIDVKESFSEDEEKMDDSPVMGLLTGQKTTTSDIKEIKGNVNKEVPSETTIKKAIRKRLSYLKANSDKVTMAGLRRLLEDDLGLDQYTLDPCKKLISQQLEEMLNSSEVSVPATDPKKNSRSKAPKKVSSLASSDSADSLNSEEENDKVKPRKRTAPKGKLQNSDGVKKQKRPEKEPLSGKKQNKPPKIVSEDNSDEEDSAKASEDGQSQSSTEKPVKKLQKKEVSTPAYGKRVEHLKSVIKSCGMSIPPSVYKKVKQAPEHKREAQLIKELAEILSREGLSENPSEKEIKEVRRKKERARELEGIDLSNIVSSSRRRSTFSFVAPPKPKIPVESDGDDAEDTDGEDDNDDDDNDDEEEEAEDNGDGDVDGDDSRSEESNEDDAKDSD